MQCRQCLPSVFYLFLKRTLRCFFLVDKLDATELSAFNAFTIHRSIYALMKISIPFILSQTKWERTRTTAMGSMPPAYATSSYRYQLGSSKVLSMLAFSARFHACLTGNTGYPLTITTLFTSLPAYRWNGITSLATIRRLIRALLATQNTMRLIYW